jgi:hypothetical protein
MPTGVLRPRIKCGAVKLTSDRALQTDKVLSYCFANKRTSTASRSRAASCSVVSWGFGFRRTRLWARPRPGALVGALVMPRKTWSGPVLPPPKFPGVAMESCPLFFLRGYFFYLLITQALSEVLRRPKPVLGLCAVRPPPPAPPRVTSGQVLRGVGWSSC